MWQMTCSVSMNTALYMLQKILSLFCEDWRVVLNPFCSDKRTTQIQYILLDKMHPEANKQYL